MADEPVRTEVRTDDGWLDFQDYFVRLRQAPDGPRGPLRRASRRPARRPRSSPRSSRRGDRHRAVEPDRLGRADPRGPRDDRRRSRGARARGVPVVAVSGIIGGKALKGPADRMLASLGHESTRAGRRPRLRRADRHVRARHRGRGARAGGRGARDPGRGDGHDHDRRRVTRPARGSVLEAVGTSLLGAGTAGAQPILSGVLTKGRFIAILALSNWLHKADERRHARCAGRGQAAGCRRRAKASDGSRARPPTHRGAWVRWRPRPPHAL